MKKQRLRERITQVELENSFLSSLVRELRAEIITLDKENDTLRTGDSVEWNKLRAKLAKVEAERDALKLQVADMERDRDVWRADANVLRDRWMAAVKVNNALKEERTKLKGDNGDPFTFWKSIVKPDVNAAQEPQPHEHTCGTCYFYTTERGKNGRGWCFANYATPSERLEFTCSEEPEPYLYRVPTQACNHFDDWAPKDSPKCGSCQHLAEGGNGYRECLARDGLLSQERNLCWNCKHYTPKAPADA